MKSLEKITAEAENAVKISEKNMLNELNKYGLKLYDSVEVNDLFFYFNKGRIDKVKHLYKVMEECLKDITLEDFVNDYGWSEYVEKEFWIKPTKISVEEFGEMEIDFIKRGVYGVEEFKLYGYFDGGWRYGPSFKMAFEEVYGKDNMLEKMIKGDHGFRRFMEDMDNIMESAYHYHYELNRELFV